jgi:hypothetical protein
LFDGSFVLSLFGTGGDMFSNILWMIMFIVFMLFYPRLIIAQMLWKLEQAAVVMERRTTKAKNIVLRKISKKPGKNIKNSVRNFLEFFAIQPISLDPYGIVKKVEHIMDMSEDRFDYFVDQVAPSMGLEEKQNIKMGMSGAVTLNSVAKIVRHFVETVRKTKNLQMALILQMQLPMIERISKALLSGTEALTNGWPIGDTIGNLAAAHLVGKRGRMKEYEKDVMLSKKTVGRRTVYIMKARGPGGRLGKIGKAVEKLVKEKKIAKIITIDAAAKLEGERTGTIAEGVGVALGGIGVDRTYIENTAVKGKIPLDSIVIKMSQEEAIQPMKKEVLATVPYVLRRVAERIKATRGSGAILVIGVGNSSGVGNNQKAAMEAEVMIKRVDRQMKIREKKMKQKKKQSLANLFWGN